MVHHKLTKELFWDRISFSYPEAMAVFNKWIDDYKKEVFWDMLFCNQTYIKPQSAFMKFHGLPDAMQIGIFIEFVRWMANHDHYCHVAITLTALDISIEKWQDEITDSLASLNTVITTTI